MPKDYIEIKLKKPIDFSSVRFSKKIYFFNEKIKVKHLDDVKISLTNRSEIIDDYVEEFLKQLAKDFLLKVSKDKDNDIRTEYACNFTDPTICDTYCDTALFFYSFTEVINNLEIKHMELMFINSKRESTPDPIVCFSQDLEVPLNFKYVDFSHFNKNFNYIVDNNKVTDRYVVDVGYIFKSLEDLSQKILIELEKQYKVDYGDEKVNLEYTCNFDTPVVYEKICNKAIFTVVRTEKIEDKIIKHLQLVLCKDKQYKSQYDDYFVRV